mgnify:CR=1 FL=1
METSHKKKANHTERSCLFAFNVRPIFLEKQIPHYVK